MAPDTAATVTVPRKALALVLRRYSEGDTTVDRDSNEALQALYDALDGKADDE